MFLPPRFRNFTLGSLYPHNVFLEGASTLSNEQQWLRHFSAPLTRFEPFRAAFALAAAPAPQDALSLTAQIALCVFTVPEKRLQRFLSRHLDGLDRKVIDAAATSAVDLRRRNDLGKPSMGLAVYPTPAYLRCMAESGRSSAGVFLSNPQLHYCLRVRLGHPLCTQDSARCIQCGKEVADADAHAMACMKGGERHLSHDTLCDGVSALLTDLGFHVSCERMLFADQRRMDLVTRVDSTTYAIDVTLVSPLLSTATSSAVTKAAAAKVAKYASRCTALGYNFVPAAFDMWGNRCPAFDAFLKRVLSVSSNISPHLQHPAAAAYTRVMMAHHRAVGSLLSSKLAGVVAHV